MAADFAATAADSAAHFVVAVVLEEPGVQPGLNRRVVAEGAVNVFESSNVNVMFMRPTSMRLQAPTSERVGRGDASRIEPRHVVEFRGFHDKGPAAHD